MYIIGLIAISTYLHTVFGVANHIADLLNIRIFKINLTHKANNNNIPY